MVIIMDTVSGMRDPELEPPVYDDEVLLAGWTEVPRLPTVDELGVMPRLAEFESGTERPQKPSPFADPDFIARIYRAQR